MKLIKCKWIFFTAALCFLLSGCKTVMIKKTENIEANVLFKRIIKNSEAMKYVNIATSVMISGNKMIPSVYIKMSADADYTGKKAILRFSVLSRKLFDIAINPEKMTLVNHTASQFIVFPAEEVNLGELLGLNFDPIDVACFLTGNVPTADDLQIMSFLHGENQNVQLNVTSSNSEYQLLFNQSSRLVHAVVNNQFFERLNIDTLTFMSKDDEEQERALPQKVKITSDTSAVSMTFLIKNVTYKKCEAYDAEIPEGYTQITDINDIKINL